MDGKKISAKGVDSIGVPTRGVQRNVYVPQAKEWIALAIFERIYEIRRMFVGGVGSRALGGCGIRLSRRWNRH